MVCSGQRQKKIYIAPGRTQQMNQGSCVSGACTGRPDKQTCEQINKANKMPIALYTGTQQQAVQTDQINHIKVVRRLFFITFY